MDRLVDKDRQCCYNCINCIAYFGAHGGGVFCAKEDCIVNNMLQPRFNCLHFSKGEYQSKSLDEASDYIRKMIVYNAVKNRRNNMRAPDKIYINNYNGNDTWGNQWHTKPNQSPSVVSHEYIRKDALLELAKELKFHLKNRTGLQHEGAKVAIDGVIELIESL